MPRRALFPHALDLHREIVLNRGPALSLPYRPEIDGLRAVAVTGVILYHADLAIGGVHPFQGGYIGVDVFFVISGYLITSIILGQMKDGTFSFARFYERRARRILPALFTVIAASIPFAWLYMLPSAVKEYSGSVLSALTFGSNIWFWQEETYWAEPNALKPFLHTWSLSVEEQFYLLFPILLLLLWKWTKTYITPLLVVILVFSLQLSDYLSSTSPEAAFYLLPTRTWELFCGASLAKLEMDKGRITTPLFNAVMPAFGLFLVGSAFLLFDDQMRHPSFITLVPVLGTMLLIWFCHKGEHVSAILSSKPFVALGIISYSLYLWHFPLFALTRINNPAPSYYEISADIVLTVLLSVITYFSIEKPARNKDLINLKSFATGILGALTLLCLIHGYAYANNGLWFRYDQEQLQIIDVRANVQPFKEYVKSGFNALEGQTFDDTNVDDDILFIGDSHAQDFYNVLSEGGYLTNKDVITHHISKRCKNVSADEEFESHIRQKYIGVCKQAVRVGNDLLDRRLQDAEMVILASSWDVYTASRLPHLVDTIETITDADILVVGRKSLGTINARQLLRMDKKERELSWKSSPDHLKILDICAQHHLDNYLDVQQLLCDDSGACPIFTPKGHLISFDGSHLTRGGAIYVSKLLHDHQQFVKFWNAAFP